MALDPEELKRLMSEFSAANADPAGDAEVAAARNERRNFSQGAAGSRVISDLTRAFMPIGTQGPGYGQAEALEKRGDDVYAEAQGERGARAAKRQAAYPLLNQYLDGNRSDAALKNAKDIADAKAKADVAEKQAASALQLDRDSQGRQFQDEQGSKRDAAALERARIAAEAAKSAAGVKATDKTEGLVKDLGKDLAETPEAANDLKILNDAAGKDDIPGFGPFEGHVPTALVSDEGARTRQAAKRAVAAYKHKITGSAASDKETTDILKSLGLNETATPEQFRQGLKDFTANGEALVRQVLAKYPQGAVDEFKARGGVTGVAPQGGGLDEAKRARLAELRAKRAAGGLK